MKSRTRSNKPTSSPNPKSKYILKQHPTKCLPKLPSERIQQQNVDIYYESSEQKSAKVVDHKKQQEECLQATLKIQSGQESHWMSEMKQQMSQCQFLSFQNSQKRVQMAQNTAILQADKFQQVNQIDFEVYCSFIARTKIYGAILVDEYGRLLWGDKMSHELLEGSLNNFKRFKIFDILLKCQLSHFLHELRSIEKYDEKTIVQWIIYSKSNKRKYKNVTLAKKPSQKDIFYHFLKALTVRIRPISIVLPEYKGFNGFCNYDLFKHDEAKNCFLLEIRLAKRSPNLSSININNDLVIRKYMKKMRTEQKNKLKDEEAKIIQQSIELQLSEDSDEGQISLKEKQFEGIEGHNQRRGRKQKSRTVSKIEKQLQSSIKPQYQLLVPL